MLDAGAKVDAASVAGSAAAAAATTGERSTPSEEAFELLVHAVTTKSSAVAHARNPRRGMDTRVALADACSEAADRSDLAAAYTGGVRVLLVSTYELGHQPHHIAVAAAALEARGHDIVTMDLAVEAWDPPSVATAAAIAVSVPMHTAARLAVEVVTRLRTERPGIPIAMFGLYAMVPAGLDGVARFAGEFAEALGDWVDAPNRVGALLPITRTSSMTRQQVPARARLPSLSSYACLSVAGEERTAGYVEASTGCRHRCRHCPVPTVYNGRINVTNLDALFADVGQQVAAGARHITFGDPDFLNAPAHSRRVVEAFANRHPGVTFDATVKVEHILSHADVWPTFADAGCLFVISAFEVLSDDILEKLDKGHTAADAGKAVHMLRDHGIEIRPSWLPFTPWTSLDDIVDIFRFIARHDLVPNTDAVQLAIRLLIPDGSLVLDLPDASDWLGPYDEAALSYTWTSPDPRLDALQLEFAQLAERGVARPPAETFREMWGIVAAETGMRVDNIAIPAGATVGRPRMTEPWFC